MSEPFCARILVVCTGNLYRSPLAAGLLRGRLAGLGHAVEVTSAGTAAIPGTPLPPATAAILRARGGDPPALAARRLTARMVERADLVLGAATEHREAAVRLAPVRALPRTFTLLEFARLLREEDAAGIADPAVRVTGLVRGAAARRGSVRAAGADDDVTDPNGSDPSVLRACAARIEESVERIARAVRCDALHGDRPVPRHAQAR
jgi:protein-tyrosine phosphatase